MSVVENILKKIESMGYIIDNSIYKLRLENLLLLYVLLENEKIDAKVIDYDIAKKVINRFVRDLSYMHFLLDLMRRSSYSSKKEMIEAMDYLFGAIKNIKDDLFWVEHLKKSCNKVFEFILNYKMPGALIDGNEEFIRRVVKMFTNSYLLCKRVEYLRDKYG